MEFLKKHWSNILFVILLVLLFVPQTGKPIRVFFSRLVAISPSVKSAEDREVLQDWNWKLINEKGEVIDFNSLKGKKVLVNFWATWCPPCVAEMPSMQALYDDYKDKAVFLFVTQDEEQALHKFLDKGKYNLPIYRPYSNPPKQLRSSSVPTTYLINEKAEILIRKVGAADWNSEKVRSLLD